MTANPALIKFINLAHAARLPKSSLERFLSAGYVPQPRQLEFHAAARESDHNELLTEICYGGARGGGKTHCIFAGVSIDDCQMFPELNVLFLRKKAGSAEESVDNLTRRILRNIAHKTTRGLVKFANDSRIKIGHFQYEKDIDQYLSLEYDCIIIEQAEQLTPAKLIDILSVNRTSRSDYKPRMYYSLNWGGVGHAYLKKKFYLPYLENREIETRFIPATVYDNRKINKGYLKNLEQLVGWKRKAWLEGSPDIAAGQFFTNFNSAIHILPPENIPFMRYAQFWCALDYGYGHYTVCYLLMKSDGKIYVLAEHADRKQPVSYHAEMIHALLARFDLTVDDLTDFVAGTDVFAQRGARDAETIADQYEECGIRLTEANTDRINGAAMILKLLGDAELNIEPKLFISSNCAYLIECLPTLEHDPKRPEDVKKVDTDENGNGGDDAYDCFVAGTLITTIRGQKPIEQIKIGELVLTREGFKPVLSSWKKRKLHTVLKAEFSDGTQITATPNHPLWLEEKGFTYLDSLRYGDIINTIWQNKYYQKQLNSMASNSDVIQTLQNPTIDAITVRAATILNEVCNHYTLKYGSQFTVKFLKALKFTIKTEIRSIIQSKIWNVLLQKNIVRNIFLKLSDLQTRENTLKQSDLCHLLGIHQLKGANGIPNTEKKFLETDRKFQNLVNNAAQIILQKFHINPVFAQINVNPNGGAIIKPTMLLNNANDVKRNFRQINTKISDFAQKSVQPVRLHSLAENGKSDVFALFVADCHEYYANGILVKNCLRYGLMVNISTYDAPESGTPYDSYFQ
jgi:phage terminase large subunit